jgi:hypothetical protein
MLGANDKGRTTVSFGLPILLPGELIVGNAFVGTPIRRTLRLVRGSTPEHELLPSSDSLTSGEATESGE